jgi:hypothetical protein
MSVDDVAGNIWPAVLRGAPWLCPAYSANPLATAAAAAAAAAAARAGAAAANGGVAAAGGRAWQVLGGTRHGMPNEL